MSISNLRRKTRLLLITLASCMFIGAPAFSAESGSGIEYTLTRQYGSVMFRVFQQQYLTLVGRFDSYAGTLYLDPARLENSRLSATVDMASVNMADADVAETLVNSSVWFNASIYPQASFTTQQTVVTGENEVEFIGELNFLGITRPWTIQVQLHPGGNGELGGSSVGISGKARLNRLDFGMDQYRNMAADDVEIEVNAKFNRNN